MSNSYEPKQLPITNPNVLIVAAGLLASPNLGLSGISSPSYSSHSGGVYQLAYEVQENQSTSSQESNLVSKNRLDNDDREFVGNVSKFYATLAEGQEPLGKEFEKVLHDNLWDLYGS